MGLPLSVCRPHLTGGIRNVTGVARGRASADAASWWKIFQALGCNRVKPATDVPRLCVSSLKVKYNTTTALTHNTADGDSRIRVSGAIHARPPSDLSSRTPPTPPLLVTQTRTPSTRYFASEASVPRSYWSPSPK